MDDKHLVMYTRSSFLCPYVVIAERIFKKYDIAYESVDIDTDEAAKQRVLNWTGFLSVPTILTARQGEILPEHEPETLAGQSPRGIDRGDMITEPSAKQLELWLQKHGFLAEDMALG